MKAVQWGKHRTGEGGGGYLGETYVQLWTSFGRDDGDALNSVCKVQVYKPAHYFPVFLYVDSLNMK